MFAIADEMAARSFSFGQALRDLASLLHRIALAQRVDALGDDVEYADEIRRLAAAFSPEEVQLDYQVALHGRNDLALAPDEYAGFTMTLLRMLAFAPRDDAIGAVVPAAAPARTVAPARAAQGAGDRRRGESSGKSPAAAVVAAGAAESKPAAAASPAIGAGAPVPDSAQWAQFVAALPLAGLVREMASHSELLSADSDHFRLRVAIKSYAETGNVEKLRAALSQHFGRPVRVSVEVGSTAGATTAASVAERARLERQRNAEQAILSDPFVKELIENFGAQVEPQSIRPRET
jgi:DNA polymerase-3 subunit gamma/tau